MEPPLDKLEQATSEGPGVNVDRLVLEYRLAFTERPLWHLAQDVQDRAFVYSNIVERLKDGLAATAIKQRFDGLGLVPEDLPNPDGSRLLEFCMRKLKKYRDCLISLAAQHGRELLQELGMQNLSAGLSATLGLPPALEVSLQYTGVPMRNTT
jgi:hypothetical protein